jgi:hypothetical protein
MMTEGVGTVKSPDNEPLPHDQRIANYGTGGVPVPKGETGEKVTDP